MRRAAAAPSSLVLAIALIAGCGGGDGDGTIVSGSTFVAADDAQPASADNPWRLEFAIADSNGGCAAGIVQGFPVPNQTAPAQVPVGEPCAAASITGP